MNFKNRLTPSEVANLMNVPRSSVYTMIRTGCLPAYKFRGNVFIDPEELKHFIEKEVHPLNSSDQLQMKVEITDSDVNLKIKST